MRNLRSSAAFHLTVIFGGRSPAIKFVGVDWRPVPAYAMVIGRCHILRQSRDKGQMRPHLRLPSLLRDLGSRLGHRRDQIEDCVRRNLAAAERTKGETSSNAFFAEAFAKFAATHPELKDSITRARATAECELSRESSSCELFRN